MKDQDGWIKCYEEKGALWIHDGNVKRPHALLTSGKHSSGFFNSELVMEDPELLDQACYDLCELASGKLNVDKECKVSRVVGPAMGAITLAHNLALQFVNGSWGKVLRAYTEKEETSAGVKMVFKRTKIIPGESILLCEDVITTAGSVKLCAQAVKEAGGMVLPVVAALVNRSGVSKVDDMQIIALINKPMPTWEADDCPLCRAGSEAIRPKGTENWARLNASY